MCSGDVGVAIGSGASPMCSPVSESYAAYCVVILDSIFV